jgi:hypothetical protein
VPARRREIRVPQHLSVVVGVGVDEARCEMEAVEVDDLVRVRRSRRGHRGDPVTVDNDVGPAALGPGAVDHDATPQHRRHGRAGVSTSEPDV